MNEWHDVGSGEAFEAACRQLGAPGFRPRLPRGLVDLNRGWKGRAKDEKETLFSKGAISALVTCGELIFRVSVLGLFLIRGLYMLRVLCWLLVCVYVFFSFFVCSFMFSFSSFVVPISFSLFVSVYYLSYSYCS